MSVLDLFGHLEENPWYLLVWSGSLPLLSFVIRWLHGPYREPLRPWRHLYSAIVYLSCVPGVFIFFAGLYLIKKDY